jgi:hypothetical protein
MQNLSDMIKNELKFEMKVGYLKVLPSFIGELIINNLSDVY